jgi:uncharacterized protein (DUF488 family)
MGQGVEKYGCNIDVRLLSVPRAVVAGAKARDQNLTSDLDGVVLMRCFKETIFNTVDDLVSDLKVFL